MSVSRREFLSASWDQSIAFSFLGRAIAYSTVPLAAAQTFCSQPAEAASTAPSLKYIQPLHVPILVAFAKVSMGLDDQDLTEQNKTVFIANCDQLMGQAPESVRADLILLFNLLQFPMSRWMMGVSDNWDRANPKDITALITNWNYGGIKILRYGYQSLLSLLQVSWYYVPVAIAGTGYPGPPESIRPYLDFNGENSP